MAVLIKCLSCGQVKRYGEWVEPPQELNFLVKETTLDVLEILCERCGARDQGSGARD
jgi:RNase P subunit RPR2